MQFTDLWLSWNIHISFLFVTVSLFLLKSKKFIKETLIYKKS